ncbi:hypothetical protein [Sedimenticola sp.]|uniref:hypothetical protein n=1 Tax=Sedimenticola sp. TaxID=1940285 RepID=UPI003D132298
MNRILTLLLLLHTGLALAENATTSPGTPIAVYQTSDDYDAIRSNLQLAITGRGMLISNTLHISDMFKRTAADTGLTDALYEQAEAFEFCNIKLSWQMSSAHPANLSICPLTIGIYSLQNQPGKVFLSYRRPHMLGESTAAEKALTDLYEGIIREALE